MNMRIQILAVLTLFMLALSPPVKAQTLDELKAEIQKMQRQINRLEAQQKRTSGQVQRQARTPPSRAPSSVQVEQAEQAAAQAQAAAQQAQQNAQQIKEQAVAETLAQFKPPPGKPGGLTVRIPQVNTTVRLYGFIKLNGTTDLTTRDRTDALSAQSIQLFGTGNKRQGGDTALSARRSRIGLETWTPINDTWGEFHTQFEMDLAGGTNPFGISASSPATNNAYVPRLRLAYADFGKSKGGWGNFLFGQQASTFNDQVLLPIQWMSDWDFVGLSNVRQAQFRYTYGFANGISASAAVESPVSDVTTVAGTSFPDQNGGGGVGWQTTPDFAGRVLWRDPTIGLLALRGVVRPQIALNNNAASAIAQRFNRSTSGWGIGLTGVINLFDGKLVLMASGNAGQGLGRYLTNTASGFSAVSNFGLPGTMIGDDASINAVGIYGGMVGAQYFFTPTLRTNMSIGGARLNYPDYASLFCASAGNASTCSMTNTSMWAAAINLVWSPFSAVDLGVEYQHLERSLIAGGGVQAAAGGVENRIQFTAIGRF